MNNKNFKVGDHILVQGNKGVVEELCYSKEYKCKNLFSGTKILTDETKENLIAKGYELEPTGRTHTSFKVDFKNEESLKNTTFNHGWYGCLDEFEMYGIW